MKIALIGDAILDVYHYCHTKPNPENTSPCYVEDTQKVINGGAINVFNNLKSLGANVTLFKTSEVSLKRRIFIGDKYICRIDNDGRYDKRDEKFLLQELKEKIDCYDYIVVSDYNKGTITRKVAKLIMSSKAKVIVDCKPNHFKWFKGGYLIKPNLKEFKKMTNYKDYKNILLTLGEKGMLLFKGKRAIGIAPYKVKVKDVTGAGDTVLATLVYYLSKGRKLEYACEQANKAGAISVTKNGCHVIKLKELKDFNKNEKHKRRS